MEDIVKYSIGLIACASITAGASYARFRYPDSNPPNQMVDVINPDSQTSDKREDGCLCGNLGSLKEGNQYIRSAQRAFKEAANQKGNARIQTMADGRSALEKSLESYNCAKTCATESKDVKEMKMAERGVRISTGLQEQYSAKREIQN